MFLPPEDIEGGVPRIHTIIQLSPQGEGSSHPPEPYFPNVLSHSWTIHAERGSTHVPLQVQTVRQRRYPRANCTKTTFTITRAKRSNPQESASYEVVHLLFESWPAKSVPNSGAHEALRELINVAYHVNKRPQYMNDELTGDPPIVLTCAEGGRTGTFIALNSLLRWFRCIQSPYDEAHVAPRVPLSPLGPPRSDIALDPVLREIDHLLDERMNMIDNENQVSDVKTITGYKRTDVLNLQLRFIYQMLRDGITQRAYLEPVFTPVSPTSLSKYTSVPRKKPRTGTRKAKL